MRAAAALLPLQRDLQEIYALEVDHKVDDFLCTNRELAEYLGGGRPIPGRRESLFVQEAGGELNLSLYLAPEVATVLERAGGLEDYCLALEGVSHFLYLVWYASHERPVTLLEMELQAEIDKFIMLRGVHGESPGNLLRRLFRQASLLDGLRQDELERYQEASRLAERYCRALERRFIRAGSRTGLLRELRSFYRRSREDKMHHIRSLEAA